MEKTATQIMMESHAERQNENMKRKIAILASQKGAADWEREIQQIRNGEASLNDVERIINRVAEHAAYHAIEAYQEQFAESVKLMRGAHAEMLKHALMTPAVTPIIPQ